jgi:hypothetical protein
MTDAEWKPNHEPHLIDPWLTHLQRRAYTTADKDGLLSRTVTHIQAELELAQQRKAAE